MEQKHIADRLELLRECLCLNKTQFAKRLSMTPAAYNVQLTRKFTEKTLSRIANALKIRREWFDENTPADDAFENRETVERPVDNQLKRAERLEMLRISLGLNKTQFAAKLNLSSTSYGHYIERGLTDKAVGDFATALRVRREWFDEDTPVEYAKELPPTPPDSRALQFIQRFLALPVEERERLIETLQKILPGQF